jgi:N-acetylmuramoyl-L-alanine amidase
MSKVILLDPGHGFNPVTNLYGRPLMELKDNKASIVPNSMRGHKNEGQPGFYREDFGTVEIATATYAALEDMGYTVYMTRSPESNMNAKYILEKVFNEKKLLWSPTRWVKEASKRWDADALVAIHTNASRGTGCSAFYAEEKGKYLAKSICKEIQNKLDLNIRRIVKHRYSILRGTGKDNSCLIECAFHDNPSDLALLIEEESINKFGQAIAIGIHKHFNPDLSN